VKRVVLGLAIILGGCADDPSTLTSGARLEVAWHEFDDGSRQLDTVEIFDAARGELCVAREWTDGASYCTPGGRIFASVTEVFTSASCDATALRVADGRSLTYVPTFEGGAIAALHRADAVTLERAWLRDEAGACAGPYATTGSRFYVRGAAVTPAELTRIDTREVDTGGRVSLRVNASDDGLSVPVGMRDAALGFDCIVRQTSTGAATCLPPRQAALRFSDASCAKPVIGQHASYTTVEPYVFAGAVCEPQGFIVGVEIPAVPGYELVDGACVATAAPIGHRWFEAAPIELATMERRRVTSGGTRLDAIEIAAGDIVLDAGNRFDTRTGGECHLASSASEPGVRRCLPQDPGFEHTYFADAACTQAVPLANVYRQAPMAKCGARLPPFAVAANRPGHYYRITASETTPVFRRDETGRCTASPMDGLAGTPLIFQMGEEVSVSEFVAARSVR
jgi:hypothetical protein